VGFLFDRTGLGLMFPIYGVLMVFFIVSALLLPNLAVHREARDLGAVRVMIRQPAWILFTVVVFLVWIASNAAITFMSVVLQSMGMKSGLIGVAVTVGAVVEMPFMIFSGALLRRFGPVKLLLVSMTLSVVRFSLLGLMKAPEWAVAINLLNGPAYVLFWTSAVNLANRLAPQGLTATAQGLLNSTTSTAGVVSALLAGWLFDRLHNGLFEVMAVFCLVALISFVVGNLHRKPAPAPEPREAGTIQ
jgi:PPP family 3-phenylpropionic acid transporter